MIYHEKWDICEWNILYRWSVYYNRGRCQFVCAIMCEYNNGGCPQICLLSEPNNRRCLCEPGYAQIGKRCKDTDECQIENGGCNQTCQNLKGSFRCSCLDGYYQTDGTNCQDINECEYLNGRCDHACENYPGNFTCLCLDGFKLMNNTCLQESPPPNSSASLRSSMVQGFIIISFSSVLILIFCFVYCLKYYDFGGTATPTTVSINTSEDPSFYRYSLKSLMTLSKKSSRMSKDTLERINRKNDSDESDIFNTDEVRIKLPATNGILKPAPFKITESTDIDRGLNPNRLNGANNINRELTKSARSRAAKGRRKSSVSFHFSPAEQKDRRTKRLSHITTSSAGNTTSSTPKSGFSSENISQSTLPIFKTLDHSMDSLPPGSPVDAPKSRMSTSSSALSSWHLSARHLVDTSRSGLDESMSGQFELQVDRDKVIRKKLERFKNYMLSYLPFNRR